MEQTLKVGDSQPALRVRSSFKSCREMQSILQVCTINFSAVSQELSCAFDG